MQIIESNSTVLEIDSWCFQDDDGYFQFEAGLWCELIDNDLYIVTLH